MSTPAVSRRRGLLTWILDLSWNHPFNTEEPTLLDRLIGLLVVLLVLIIIVTILCVLGSDIVAWRQFNYI
jgi:hypothetical protein